MVITKGLEQELASVSVGHLSLDHAGSLLSLRAVIGGFHLAGIIVEDQKLISRTRYFGCGLAGRWLLNRGTEMLLRDWQELGECRSLRLGAFKLSLDYAIVSVVKHTGFGPCQSTASHDNSHRI